MTHPKTTRRAFTIAEALLALTIMAILLTAVGTAFHASLRSYSENEKIAVTTQAARAMLDRMMREVRTAAAVEANSTALLIVPAAEAGSPTLIRYDYDSPNKRLIYTRTTATDSNSYILFDDEVHLTSFSLQKTTGQDWKGLSCVKAVRVKLGLTMGKQTFTVSSSSAPRRNQLY